MLIKAASVPLSTRPANSTNFAGLVDLVEYELDSFLSIAIFNTNKSLHFDRSRWLESIERMNVAFVETTFSRPLEISFKLSKKADSWPIKDLKLTIVPDQIGLAHRNASIEGERTNGYRACATFKVLPPTQAANLLLSSIKTNQTVPSDYNNSSLPSPTLKKFCSGPLNYKSSIYIRFYEESRKIVYDGYEPPNVRIYLNPRIRTDLRLYMHVVNSKADDPRLLKFVQVEMNNPTASLREYGLGPGFPFSERIFVGDPNVKLHLSVCRVTFENELEFSNSTLQWVKDMCSPLHQNEGLFMVVNNRSLERIITEFPGKIKIFQNEKCPVTIYDSSKFEAGPTDFKLTI